MKHGKLARKADHQTKRRSLESIPIPVVGIGASAGGLDAFERLLRRLPPDTGMAFVLLQHLDPKHESLLTEILSRATSMPVSEVRHRMRIARNHVYVIPPNSRISLRNSSFHLEPRRNQGYDHLPVDFFFRSLARVQGNRAIGVILSGTASDGVAGMKAIKAEGGITFAQDSESAKYFGMPQSSIATGAVDFVLTPELIADHLARLARFPYLKLRVTQKETPPLARPREEADPRAQLFALLKRDFHVDFSEYKQSTVDRRIQRRLALHTLDNLKDYLAYIAAHPDELRALYQDMFIGVTSFFREPGFFQTLHKNVLPKLLKNRPSDSPIRIWVPGCSTGEEVYSIAITLLEHLRHRVDLYPIQIFGTDINEESIKKARLGIYLPNIAAEVGPVRLRRYFVKTAQGYQVSKTVRDMCIFAKHDVTRDPPFSRLDLICCRNVLIYLGPRVHQRLLPLFHYSLKPSGSLCLGSAESIGPFLHLFRLLNRRQRIYAKKPMALLPRFEAMHEDTPVLLRSPRPATRDTPAPAEFQKETADRIVLNHYAPPSVVVNENLEILQFRGHTSTFLEPAPGAASLNLYKMAREGLLAGLRSAMQTAIKKGVQARADGLHLETDSREVVVNIHVVPITPAAAGGRTFLVLFEQPGAAPFSDSSRAQTGKSLRHHVARDRAARYREELASTKAYLQSVIENQEASNEELRSLNEEMMSTNEELQSTTEELETANEELQSANEELTTLNEELQSTNAELAVANNDILNLLNSMAVGVILLDRTLCIRRFTPAAKRRLNLVPADIGRRLSEIRLPFDAPELGRLLPQVIETGQAQVWEAQANDGRWYSLQIRPYLTSENQIDGAILIVRDVAEDVTRLAHEIHDTLAQNLAGIILQLEGADQVFMEDAQASRNHIQRALREARSGLAQARQAIQALHPSAGEDLSRAIRLFIDELTSGTSVTAKLSVQGEPRRLPVATAENLFRMAQEAVRNAVNHGKPSEILVLLIYDPEAVRLVVEDNGQGFSTNSPLPAGRGLAFLKERTQSVGGRLSLRSEPGKGARVEVSVPDPPRERKPSK